MCIIQCFRSNKCILSTIVVMLKTIGQPGKCNKQPSVSAKACQKLDISSQTIVGHTKKPANVNEL